MQSDSGSQSPIRDKRRRNSESSDDSAFDSDQERRILEKLMQKEGLKIESQNVQQEANQNNKSVLPKKQAMDVQDDSVRQPSDNINEKSLSNPSQQLDSVQIVSQRPRKLEGDGRRSRSRSQSRSRSRDRDRRIRWHIYADCQEINVSKSRFPQKILHLPIFEKKTELIQKIKSNQFVLVTGQTGCGKSTQVPRLIYEYLRITGEKGNILCVQPRRLAVLNLYHILESQMQEKDLIGYQIAMQTKIKPKTRILFMTNGIFLQRLVHSSDIFQEYPFIILDEVHERDIDTDFILLAIKRIARKHPKLRVILMSATIDNELFKYYFAEDHIDKFLKQENFYKRIMQKVKEEQANQRHDSDDQDSRSDNEQKLYKKLQYEFMESKHLCPAVNITEIGKHSREFFYLDTLDKFLHREFNMKWGSVIFSQKYPNTHRELYDIVNIIIEEVIWRSPREDKGNESVLIFLPGLLEIQTLGQFIRSYFGRQKIDKDLQILAVHSSILTKDLTDKLHSTNKKKIKIILATNIAESSITVMGVKYVVDFCLSKEVHFDQKSRMENLELIWASQASCKQRAGRTGRVCDGFIIRLVENKFFAKLPEYSTPQIQRSSLDRLILRIKMIHQNEVGNIFSQPGDVLGTAIQPPRLKNIDQAVKSLLFCGGLRMQKQDLILTPLGRLYIDLPIDICYSKMLIMSILFGTFEDVLILVAILSQNKNPFRRATVERNYLQYYELINNPDRCDFQSLIRIYLEKGRMMSKSGGRPNYQKNQNQRNNNNHRNQHQNMGVRESMVRDFDIYNQTRILIDDLYRRIDKKGILVNYQTGEGQPDYNERFKITILAGFLNKIISVREPIYDDKQEKRSVRMQKMGIQINNTLTLMNSQVIRKKFSDNDHADQKLISMWKGHIQKNIRIDPQHFFMTVTEGLSYIHFKEEADLNKLLFVKLIEEQNRKTGTEERPINSVDQSGYINTSMLLRILGDFDYMQQGSMYTLFKDQRIAIDNFSQNRVVGVNVGQRKRFLMTNTVMQQSSRLFSRYTSLIPDINNVQSIAHLIFYPFITLLPDRKNKKIEELYLKKKTRLKIDYEITQQQITEANRIRKILKNFLTHDFGYDMIQNLKKKKQSNNENDHGQGREDYIAEQPQAQRMDMQENGEEQNSRKQTLKKRKVVDNQKEDRQHFEERLKESRNFWPLVKKFLYKQRITAIDENKWHHAFFKQCNIGQGMTQTKFEPYRRPRNPGEDEEERQFMNQVVPKPLESSYFSSLSISPEEYNERINLYHQWKLKKIDELTKLKEKVMNTSPFLCCGQCHIPIAAMQFVGSIQNTYYRDVYRTFNENIKIMPFSGMGNHFCSYLMNFSISKSYEIYGCINDHYLAIKLEDEKNIKVVSFAPLKILFPDDSLQSPDFHHLDQGKWFRDNERAKQRRKQGKVSEYCFICDMKFDNFKELEKHFRDPLHEENIKDFKKGMNTDKNQKKEVQM